MPTELSFIAKVDRDDDDEDINLYYIRKYTRLLLLDFWLINIKCFLWINTHVYLYVLEQTSNSQVVKYYFAVVEFEGTNKISYPCDFFSFLHSVINGNFVLINTEKSV